MKADGYCNGGTSMGKSNPFKKTIFACYRGYVTQAIVNNLAPLLFIIFQTRFSLSFEMIGNLILLNFGTQLAVDVIVVKFAEKIGYRRLVILAHMLCAAGLIALSVLPNVMGVPFAGMVIAVILYAMGGGIIEVMINPIVDAIPGDDKASAMSMLHSFYCWGQVLVVLLTTLVLGWIGQDLWVLLPVAWAALPIYNAFRFAKVPMMPPVAEHEKIPIKKMLASKVFIIAMVLMLCAGAAELTMAQWASLFAEKAVGVSKVMGDLLGPCLFAALMGVGRTIYGVFGKKINLTLALAVSSVLCMLSYLMAALSGNPAMSLAGLALCGFAVSIMWPGVVSYSASHFAAGGTAMFGILAIFGDFGCSVGPWVMGMVSGSVEAAPGLLTGLGGLTPDQLGLKVGLFAAVVFPAIMLAGVLAMRKAGAPKAARVIETE